ncbi:MAG: M28 family metallopeptidase [Flavobacteriales bacterium]|jgi:hypothetical protein|nr:M28 family metallopeptidase [Flavobacteriales bacterium]
MRFLILFLITPFIFYSQTPQEYGKDIVKTLASPEFYGRGYVNDGSEIAADFVVEKFKEYGLKPYHNTYKQPFNLTVNTFPTVVEMTIDGKALETGKEFVVSPISGSCHGEYVPFWIDSANFPKVIEDLKSMRMNGTTAFIMDKKGISNKDTLALFNELKYYLSTLGPVITIEEEKFTWSVGRQEASNAIVAVLRKNISKSIEKVAFNIENKLEENYEVANVIGYIEGKCKKKNIVITSHFDHLGMMGQKTYFPGANDNASGTAMFLYLAQYYSTHQPKYNIVFMSFAAEEAGILGSKHYTEHPLFPLDEIKFLVNLDLAGTGEEGVTVVNATLHKKEFKKLGKINLKNNYMEKVKLRGPAANSDHYFFTQKGVPAFFIYTNGGIKAYHDVYDKSETLPLTEFNDYSELLIAFIKKL